MKSTKIERPKYTESVHLKLSKEQLSEAWKAASALGVGISDILRISLIAYLAGIKEKA